MKIVNGPSEFITILSHTFKLNKVKKKKEYFKIDQSSILSVDDKVHACTQVFKSLLIFPENRGQISESRAREIFEEIFNHFVSPIKRTGLHSARSDFQAQSVQI